MKRRVLDRTVARGGQSPHSKKVQGKRTRTSYPFLPEGEGRGARIPVCSRARSASGTRFEHKNILHPPRGQALARACVVSARPHAVCAGTVGGMETLLEGRSPTGEAHLHAGSVNLGTTLEMRALTGCRPEEYLRLASGHGKVVLVSHLRCRTLTGVEVQPGDPPQPRHGAIGGYETQEITGLGLFTSKCRQSVYEPPGVVSGVLALAPITRREMP